MEVMYIIRIFVILWVVCGLACVLGYFLWKRFRGKITLLHIGMYVVALFGIVAMLGAFIYGNLLLLGEHMWRFGFQFPLYKTDLIVLFCVFLGMSIAIIIYFIKQYQKDHKKIFFILYGVAILSGVGFYFASYVDYGVSTLPKIEDTYFTSKFENIYIPDDKNGYIVLQKLLKKFNTSTVKYKQCSSESLDTFSKNIFEKVKNISCNDADLKQIDAFLPDLFTLSTQLYFKDTPGQYHYYTAGFSEFRNASFYSALSHIQTGEIQKGISILGMYDRIAKKMLEGDGKYEDFLNNLTSLRLIVSNMSYLVDNVPLKYEDLSEIKTMISSDIDFEGAYENFLKCRVKNDLFNQKDLFGNVLGKNIFFNVSRYFDLFKYTYQQEIENTESTHTTLLGEYHSYDIWKDSYLEKQALQNIPIYRPDIRNYIAERTALVAKINEKIIQLYQQKETVSKKKK